MFVCGVVAGSLITTGITPETRAANPVRPVPQPATATIESRPTSRSAAQPLTSAIESPTSRSAAQPVIAAIESRPASRPAASPVTAASESRPTLPPVDTPLATRRSTAANSVAKRPAGVAPAPSRQRNQSSGSHGTLVVTSNPRGANVFINNDFAGRTPLTLRSLPAGSRAVRVGLDGYAPWSRGIRVVANQSTTVAAVLTRSKSSN